MAGNEERETARKVKNLAVSRRPGDWLPVIIVVSVRVDVQALEAYSVYTTGCSTFSL